MALSGDCNRGCPLLCHFLTGQVGVHSEFAVTAIFLHVVVSHRRVDSHLHHLSEAHVYTWLRGRIVLC